MLNVLIHTDTRYPVNRKTIRKAVLDVLKNHNIDNLDAEVSVAVVGKRKMKKLSLDYLKEENGVHEILSFPLDGVLQTQNQNPALPAGTQGFINAPDEILRLGDVVLSWPMVLEAASEDDIMVDEEVYKLIAHGVEHLLGNHHE